MRSILIGTAIVWGVVAGAGGAAAQPEDHSRVPVDPGAICDALREEYASGWCDERVRVTVERDAGGNGARTDSFTVRVRDAGASLGLELGPLRVWTQDRTVYAVHEEEPEAYFEARAQEGESVAGLLARVLPPIPSPHAALVLSRDTGCPGDLAYVAGLRWTGSEVDAEARPATARVRGEGGTGSAPGDGEGGGVRVELEATLEPVRLRRFVIDHTREGRRIVGEVTRVAGGPTQAGEDAPALGVDLTGRTRVGSVRELAPGPGAWRLGDVVPPLMVHPVGAATPGVAAPLEPVSGPSVIVLFREWNRDAAIGVAAGVAATEAFAEYRVVPVAVYDRAARGETPARAWVDGLLEKIRPLDLWYATSPERTVERVSPYADVGVLVLDADRVVRLVERIDNIHAYDEPTGALTGRIAAAISSR